MTLYLPIVPSSIDGFECIPIKYYDNSTDVFASQTTGENKFKFYYDTSLLNQESDYTHVGIRFLSLDSEFNPIIGKYSTGTYIAAKQSNSAGNYIEVPAHIFIQPANTVAVNNIRIDPSDNLPKIVTGLSPTTYRNITYQDYDLIENSGVNKNYRSQIKLINLTSANNLAYTASTWQTEVRAGTSVGSASAIITVSSSTGILPGLNASGAGILPGVTVASVSGTTITLSANSTQTTTTTVSFYVGQTFLNDSSKTYVSDWSYQTIMKPVFISNLIGFDPQDKEYIGIVDFKSRNTSSGSLFTTSNTASGEIYTFEFSYPPNEEETVIQYEFKLFDSSKVQIDGSGLIEFEQYLTQTSVKWSNNVTLVDNQNYYITIFFKTKSGFEYTKAYEFTADYTLVSLGAIDTVLLTARNDKENGRIELELRDVTTASNAILLLKSSLDEGYDNFKVQAVFETQGFSTASSTRKYFYDYLIEPGMLYRYKLQAATINNSGDIISRDASTTPSKQPRIIPDFTGSFLYGKDDIQINLLYDGQVSSFKNVKKDAIVETIGGKFPFVIRNSNLGYKQFQFSAMITHVSDPLRFLKGQTYTELISNLKRDSNDNYMLSIAAKDRDVNERYEDFLINGPQFFTTSTSSYAILSDFGKNNIFKQSYMPRTENYIVEKQFRKKLIDWLSDGTPKVFKSDTEGLFLVKITDISLEPVVELGRTLYRFSCTVTEIGEVTYENLVKYGIKKKKYDSTDVYLFSNIDGYPVAWTQNTLYISGQYFYVVDTTSQVRFYLVQSDGTSGTTAPLISETNVETTYTSGTGTYTYKFVGYKIPGSF
jgi:hypothetical protein